MKKMHEYLYSALYIFNSEILPFRNVPPHEYAFLLSVLFIDLELMAIKHLFLRPTNFNLIKDFIAIDLLVDYAAIIFTIITSYVVFIYKKKYLLIVDEYKKIPANRRIGILVATIIYIILLLIFVCSFPTIRSR
jgi:hypothetical protein